MSEESVAIDGSEVANRFNSDERLIRLPKNISKRTFLFAAEDSH